MKQIKVTITPEGQASVEATGFKNNACKKATKPIEEALGTVEKVSNKPEALIQESNTNQATNSYGW
jgi:hypothetical protein